MDVLSDVYPYTAGSTNLTAVMPQWSLEGGVDALIARLADPEARARIRAAITSDGPEILFPLDSIMLGHLPGETADTKFEGMLLTDIAAERGEHPAETAFSLLERYRGGVQIIVFILSEVDVRRCLRHPSVAIASDGSTLSPAARGKPHPRSYGTFVRVLGTYVREEKLLSLEDAIRKMTSLPAQRLRRFDLGLVRPGCHADLVVFDPATVADRATYRDPHQFATGVHYVVVNGQLVVEEGNDTGTPAGRVLRRGQP
jgi:N-acyl-D-amino-acid deacylase